MKALRTTCVIALLAFAVLISGAVSTAQATVSATYTNGPANGTVDVSVKTTQRNDIEIQCDCSDVAGNFATATPNWSVTSIIKRDRKCFVRLTRTSLETADETITVTGPKDRGKKGTVSATKDGVVVDGTSGAQTFASFNPIPALSTWGLILLIVALCGAAIWVIRRRSSAVAA